MSRVLQIFASSCFVVGVAVFMGCQGDEESSYTPTAESNLKDGLTEETKPDVPNTTADKSESTAAATKPAASRAKPSVDWPGFRGPSGLATSATAKPPIKWSHDNGIIWKSKLPGRGASSPIVAGDKVFVAAYSGYGISAEEPGSLSDLIHHIMCFDRKQGKLLWSRKIKGSYANRKLNDNLLGHGFASSTPVTDGKHVYTFFGVSGVHAFDMDGNFKWQTDVGELTDNFGSSASLTLHKNLLIVNASIEAKTVYALNKNTGRAVWKIDDIDRSWSTPVVGIAPNGSPELIINEKDSVHGYDPVTGEKLWHCEGIHDYVIAAPVIVDGVCYLNGGREKRTLAIKLGGRGDVTATHKLWEVPMGANVSSCIHFNDQLFVVSDNGIMHCLDAATGKLIKKKRLKTKKRVFASPMRVNNHFLLPTQDIGVLVMKADSKCKIVAENWFDGDNAPLQASIAASGHRMFIRSDNYLYCIGSNPNESKTFVNDFQRSQTEIIVPLKKHDFDKSTGRTKPYLNYFLTDPDEMVKFMLKPYESVITQEQVAKSTAYIKDNMQPFLDLRKRHAKLKWRKMRDDSLTDELFLAELNKIEQQTIKQNRKVRKLIKDQFSKEQLDQHLNEAADRNKKE